MKRVKATITEEGDWWRIEWTLDGVTHERREPTAVAASRFFSDWATWQALNHGVSTTLLIEWVPTSAVGRAVVRAVTGVARPARDA